MKKLGLALGILVVSAVGLAIAARPGVSPSPEEHAVAPGSLSKSATGASASSGETMTKAAPAPAANAMAAIDRAARAKKYLFVFFWRDELEPTLAMRKVFEAARAKVSDRADSLAVRVTDPAEKEIVAKFMLDRAPMPLVLALAPNGAMTGGFPTNFAEKDLLDAFASPCTAQCMKYLQENKLVLLCVQNDRTKSNDAALQAARDFKADARFSEASEIVILDPADKAEAKFLSDLKINPSTPEAVTAFLAPPGTAIALFEGPVTKDALVNTLQTAMSSPCAGGSCGPGGCAPKP